jgi:hypothetical protein
MENQNRIIEIAGVKFEADMRSAKRVETFRVGDPVKVLIKQYSDSYNSLPGVIVGFDDFKNKPAINVLYVSKDYSGVEVKYKTITADEADCELSAADPAELVTDIDRVFDILNQAVLAKQNELDGLLAKRAYFRKHIGDRFDDFCKAAGLNPEAVRAANEANR